MNDRSSAFELLARQMLARNPAIQCEWRSVHDKVWGHRVDLVCNAGSPDEVWASIRDYTIAVGDANRHVDFESFGPDLGDALVAAKALSHFAALLREHGHPDAAA